MIEQKEAVDWGYWSALSSITIREAACLLAGIEPFEFDPQTIDGDSRLKKAYTMLFRALQDQQLNRVNIYGSDFYNEPRFDPWEIKKWIEEKQKQFFSIQTREK